MIVAGRRWQEWRGLVLAAWLGIGLAAAGHAQLLDTRIDAANKLYAEAKYVDAAKAYREIIDQFQKALPQHPRGPEVWQNFGTSLARLEKFDAAKKALDRAEALRKTLPPGLRSAGSAAVSAPAAAATSGGAAGAGSPAMPSASAGSGSDDEVAGRDIASPTGDLNRYHLATIKNEKAQDHYRRARAYLDDQMPHYAGPELIAAVDLEPENADLLALTGPVLIDLDPKHHARARAALEKLAKIRKDQLSVNEQVALARSLILTARPDLKRAETLLKAVLAKEPKHFVAHLATGELEYLRGEYAKALAAFTAAAALQNQDPRPVWGKADSLLKLKRNDEALACYRDAMSLEPRNPMAHVKLGRALLEMGRVIEASARFDRAILLDPTCVEAHLDLVELQLPRNHDMSARVHLEAAVELDPGNPRVHLLTGIRHEMQANLPAAIRSYQLAAAYGGEAGLRAKQRLANIYAGVGHAFPGNTFTNTVASDLAKYQAYADLVSAARLYQEILAVNPKHPDAEVMNERIAKAQRELQMENELMNEVRHHFGTRMR